MTVQVETVAWTQVSGEDKYTPTQDLLVNPPLFSIPPGRSQILRVGLRRPPDDERETAYRLFLREVPPGDSNVVSAGDGATGKVRVLLELRLPIYVAPAKIIRAQQWRARRTTNGGIALEVVNTGNVRLVVGELKLHAADAAPDAPPLALTKTSTVVFPGQSRRWEMHAEKPLTAPRIVLEVATDRGTQNVALDVVPE